MTILLVEDEADLAQLLVDQMRGAGLVVDRVGSLDDAVESVRQFPYDLVLLDRRLPDGDGLSIVPQLRRTRPGIRVLVVTALDGASDRVEGLDSGADDYLIKPFDTEELLARIRASLRRPGCEISPPIAVGALSFDLATRNASVGGRALVLHGRELALLEALIRRVGRVVSRSVLMGEVYGLDEDTLPNSLDVLVSRLRKRLGDAKAGTSIYPARGIGYILTETQP
ncbi:response regulator transcription factor [Methylosinus sp. LW4]|uniref:response regulator transcription factor n=1 Tax=Methylosinus sp. LW4 TaxID=136993 RepID=UPI00036C7418|nr:response regulator transcription factor [Methylosinus sp. LW4]